MEKGPGLPEGWGELPTPAKRLLVPSFRLSAVACRKLCRLSLSAENAISLLTCTIMSMSFLLSNAGYAECAMQASAVPSKADGL